MIKRLLLCGAVLSLQLHAIDYPSDCDPAHSTIGYFSETPSYYEPYPGTAYESSFTTTQIVTSVVVGAAFIALIAVAFTNTPGDNTHHGHH
ncbi:MAG: hypothetical protein H0T62_07645 [Parachlamydiaceae bacterium]|nr:hypothetical protein [Parachlamydiaceae bacterium]